MDATKKLTQKVPQINPLKGSATKKLTQKVPQINPLKGSATKN